MPRLSRTLAFRLALFLLVVLALCGCGYHFAGSGASDGTEQGSRLAPDQRNMALVRVDNPSTESWLEPRLRSLIRDEFNRRRLVNWTDRAKATSLLTITIKRFTRSTALAGQADQSVKLSTSITVVFRITRATDGAVIWDSGEQVQNESFYPGDSDGADQRLTDLLVRRMADLITENY
ncbi:MAG: LPS assembly lipoprotein LptE [Humidesulfovibrio sp.]|jgi:outer membrane lipopolysaccharide assembly protein LptE/RlpB|uniref:LPS assembly lipoprotein LptE n=1 Tax=Humidesulfovibrio sp. TaxID=2910988 RepID=UPI0027356FAB|nr:LPS assembly lipoprotein LptE [Humidesulfovibrio sp.]MDP2848988.1 LPS assembly lipoprotein LptE [Humidesulfovibrio sp.]